ncbi:MAG: hypothetical protein JSV30_05285 [Candidatus Omnitrophota bacterium]|nr:MAG: hypothetical protein JSV30_05285 [Candidatus Omnitrophota bacterium]
MHSKRLIYATILMFLVSSGISFAYNKREKVKPSTELQVFGVKFVSPAEKGWVKLVENPGQLALGKEGNSKYETYAITASLFKLPSVDSEEDFLACIRKGRKDDTDPERFKILEDQDNLCPEKGSYYVAYHTLSEDYAAAKMPRDKEYLLFEMTGFYWRSAYNPNIGIHVGYSQRCFPENQDPDFDKKAEYIIDQFKLSEAQ